MIPPYTVVIGVDRHTLPYLEITLITWRSRYPELFDRPWIAFHDLYVEPAAIQRVVGYPVSELRCVPWLGHGRYETQREKMLSGHVYIAAMVETDYFLKIDCDAIAISRTDWPKAEWFADRPVLIGPTWGYWRAKGGGGELVDWVERLESIGDKEFGTERANWHERIGSWDHPKGPKLRDRGRFASWLAFQRTDWVQDMAARFARHCGPGHLPVPSHDTSLYAMAKRSGAEWLGVAVKPGWTNRVTLSGCRQAVAELKL